MRIFLAFENKDFKDLEKEIENSLLTLLPLIKNDYSITIQNMNHYYNFKHIEKYFFKYVMNFTKRRSFPVFIMSKKESHNFDYVRFHELLKKEGKQFMK